MSYDYWVERDKLFSNEGQRMFLQIRDRVQRLLKNAGAVRMQEATVGFSGSSWDMLACLDRMVELGELRELTDDVAGQHRVFVSVSKNETVAC